MRLLGKIDEDLDVINRKYADDNKVTVNNGQLTIQRNGTNVATFTANQSGNSTANITVPTKTSELTNDSGFVSDLSNYVTLNSAQTITGTKTFKEFTGGLINNSHIENSYINTQPEGNGSILPFLYNDLAFYYIKGGTTTIYTTTETDYTKNTLTHTKDLTPSNTSNMFDGSPSYCTNWGISATTDVVIIDMSLPYNFAYSTYFYIDFGTGSWYARQCKLLLWNSNNPTQTYTLKKEWDETTSYHFVKTSYSYVNSEGTTVQGFNRIRLVLTSFGTVNPRVAQIGLINYGSSGVRNTYMSRGIDDYLYRNITPNSTNTYNLGDSSHKWKNVFATSFRGALGGNGRITSADITHYYTDNIAHQQLDIASSSMTTNKPASDGFIQTFLWDNSGAYDSQLFIPNTSDYKLQVRYKANQTNWGNWINIPYSTDIPTKVSQLTNDSGYTTNTGTITGIKMNGASKGTSGVVDLGTVLTSHQAIKTINNNTMTGTGNVSVGTITGVSVNGTSVATSGVANITSIPSNIVTPAITKTYTGIIGDASSNTLANNAFFFGSVRPTSFTGGWSVTYRVHIWVPSNSNFDAVSEVHFFGDQASINSYAIFNHIYSTSYRPAYYHTIARLKSAGYTAGYGHALAVNLADSNSRGDTNLTRTLVVEVLEQNNCTVTLNDTAVKWASWPGTGTTNYNDPGNYNFSANGMQESGDNDTTYQLRSYYERPLVDTGKLYGYNLCTLTSNNKLTGFVTSYSTGNTKTKNTATFMVDAPIFYYGTSAEKAADTYPADNTIYLNTSSVDLRYSTNCAQTLTANKPVYLVGIPNGATYTLADTWWTQTLPTTDDGKIYIYLGVAYSTYQIAWQPEHPAYWFKNGMIQVYTGNQGNTIDNAWNCTCTTAAGTAAKVVSCSESGFSVKVGTIIAVSFTNSNTASSVTLNVNSSGAKSISNHGTVYTGNDPEMTGYAGRLLYYQYDGLHWNWLNIFAETFNAVNNAGNAANIAVVAASSYNPANYPNNTIIITY